MLENAVPFSDRLSPADFRQRLQKECGVVEISVIHPSTIVLRELSTRDYPRDISLALLAVFFSIESFQESRLSPLPSESDLLYLAPTGSSPTIESILAQQEEKNILSHFRKVGFTGWAGRNAVDSIFLDPDVSANGAPTLLVIEFERLGSTEPIELSDLPLIVKNLSNYAEVLESVDENNGITEEDVIPLIPGIPELLATFKLRWVILTNSPCLIVFPEDGRHFRFYLGQVGRLFPDDESVKYAGYVLVS
jgi:hypothetical protein